MNILNLIIAVLVAAVVKGENGCRQLNYLPCNLNKTLSGHVIKTIRMLAPGQDECRRQCFMDDRCVSYNLGPIQGPIRSCELSDTDHVGSPDDVKSIPGSEYCPVKNPCTPDSCLNYRVRKPDFNWNKCTCTGASMGTRSSPAKSCLEILKTGNSNGTGEYWLDPANTGSPLRAYCDMTTDGGGWTIVRKITLKNSTLPINKPYNNYKVIADHSNNNNIVLPTGKAMLSILQVMGFHQIHFYCHKNFVGRVVSIMTKNTTAGQQVVRYFTNNAFAQSTFPTACGSFDKMPEDTSILAQNCSKWGKDASGRREVNKWGSSGCNRGGRLASCPFVIVKTNNRRLNVGCYRTVDWAGFCCCDDYREAPANLSTGDKWQISVR